jgi:hypothetical protein
MAGLNPFRPQQQQPPTNHQYEQYYNENNGRRGLSSQVSDFSYNKLKGQDQNGDQHEYDRLSNKVSDDLALIIL